MAAAGDPIYDMAINRPVREVLNGQNAYGGWPANFVQLVYDVSKARSSVYTSALSTLVLTADYRQMGFLQMEPEQSRRGLSHKFMAPLLAPPLNE